MDTSIPQPLLPDGEGEKIHFGVKLFREIRCPPFRVVLPFIFNEKDTTFRVLAKGK
jgi:hypothetical protein